jgi:hypothetical protein
MDRDVPVRGGETVLVIGIACRCDLERPLFRTDLTERPRTGAQKTKDW